MGQLENAPGIIIGEARFLDRKGTCRECGSKEYTVRELNLHEPDFRCYRCRDLSRIK